MRFTGQAAIVTGAASGIGYATAARLAQEGASVIVVDCNAQAAQRAAAQIGPEERVTSRTCDVSKAADVCATVDFAFARYGRLDIIVNNAGIMIFKPLEAHTEDDMWRVLRVDFMGAFLFIKQAFLKCSEGCAIVNVSSVHAVETTPLVTAYAAAKCALLSLSRSAAIEGRSRKIRVNTLLPGAVETPMLRQNPNLKSGAETLDAGSVGRPEDVAAAIAYLVSEDARFVQGSALRVDGGRLARL